MNAITAKAIRIGGVLLWAIVAARPVAAQPAASAAAGVFGPAPGVDLVEPQARRWKTFVLASGSELRLPPPPRMQQIRAELDQMKARIATLNDADLAKIRYWDAGPPSYRWVEIAIAQFQQKPMSPPKVQRGLSLMNVAIFDALVTAWDSKYLYARRRPAALDPNLETSAETPASPSYPSEHAVVAGAASEILAYLYPADAQLFRDKAQEDADSRVLAGVQFPSDSTAGLDLGRAVAERVIERAKTDGSDAVWTGTVPPGPGKWNGTNPQDPLAGTWMPWILTTAADFRPGPPPAYDSPEEAADLAEIKNFPRTFASNSTAFYWQTVPGLYADWYRTAGQRIFEHHLDKNPPRAARIYALLSIAHYDAILAVFDAKYAYWAIRPFQLDPTVVTLFTTPNHPSYPAAHATVSTSISEALAYAFPDEAAAIRAKGAEAGVSRIWAGIHFRHDVDAGTGLGAAVAAKVIERFENDGSQ